MIDLQAAAAARIGQTLCGKYKLEALIGTGGMAAVYRSRHRNGKRVAVKVLYSHLSLSAEFKARFLREGYVANSVEHPSAVQVLDDDTAEDGAAFIVMELLDGESLDAKWERAGHKLPAEQVSALVHQLLDVLAAAHERGIVHRDIKPENLFVVKSGQLKVLDFGIARMVDPAARALTKTGRMMGTPAYMPPEQALGRSRQIGPPTDVWSTGATMFALLSGEFVHASETVEEMLIHAGSRQARSILTAVPTLPAPIAHIIDKALAFDPHERWADGRAMEIALEGAHRAAFGTALPNERGEHAGQLEQTKYAPPVSAVAITVDATQLGATRAPPTERAIITPPPASSPLVPVAIAAAPARSQTILGPVELRRISTTAGLGSAIPPPVEPTVPKRRAIGVAIVAAAIAVVGGGLLAATRLLPRAPDATAVAPPQRGPERTTTEASPGVIAPLDNGPGGNPASRAPTSGPSEATPGAVADQKPGETKGGRAPAATSAPTTRLEETAGRTPGSRRAAGTPLATPGSPGSTPGNGTAPASGPAALPLPTPPPTPGPAARTPASPGRGEPTQAATAPAASGPPSASSSTPNCRDEIVKQFDATGTPRFVKVRTCK